MKLKKIEGGNSLIIFLTIINIDAYKKMFILTPQRNKMVSKLFLILFKKIVCNIIFNQLFVLCLKLEKCVKLENNS